MYCYYSCFMYVLNPNIWTEVCHAFAVIFIGPAKTTKTVRFKSNVGERSNGKLLIAFIQCMLPFLMQLHMIVSQHV